MRRVVLDYLHRLYIAVKSDKNTIISKLGFDSVTEIEKQIRTAENRVSEIDRLLKQVYEQKFHCEISDLQFKNKSVLHRGRS